MHGLFGEQSALRASWQIGLEADGSVWSASDRSSWSLGERRRIGDLFHLGIVLCHVIRIRVGSWNSSET